MLVIGLTGGIGSGKSTVADLFAQLGVPVIDTDKISRQLVQPGQPALSEIINTFGEITEHNGQLDRNKLRQLIFEDEKKRAQLEKILHPKIQQEVKTQLTNKNHPYTIVVIPLLAEKGKYPFIDRVLVVDCDEQLQLERAMNRDNQKQTQIENIIRTQASRQQRLDIADDIINNDSDINDLKMAVEQLDSKYQQLADN